MLKTNKFHISMDTYKKITPEYLLECQYINKCIGEKIVTNTNVK